MNSNWKKALSMLMAASLVLPMGAIPTQAAATEQKEINTQATVENVDIASMTSEVWETPEIPRAATSVQGVANPEIDLNETTGDGTWKFLFETADVPAPTEENQDFDFTALSDKQWDNIKVPGEILMQGYDLNNNNEYYYQRDLAIPADYTDNRVILRFDGVYSNARVWVDGKYVRTHIGGFTTWDCDITDYVTPGSTAKLTIGVADVEDAEVGIWNPDGVKLGDASWGSVYAHHNMGGINRDVSLLALPKNYVTKSYVETEFDEEFVNADLQITTQIGMTSAEATVKYELLDESTAVVQGEALYTNPDTAVAASLKELQSTVKEADALIKEHADNLYTGSEGKPGQYSKAAYDKMVAERDAALKTLKEQESKLSDFKKITIPVAQPKQWDAEHPNLYTLRTSVLVDGTVVETTEQKVGFREIYYGGEAGSDSNKLYVNGKEVKLRGTCRHDVSYDLGRSTTRDQDYREIEAYKKANINYIRTSHYPPSENLLEACDEMGIYVEEETGANFQGGNGQDINCTPEEFIAPFTEMIERDRNHASVLIWSLANESDFEGSTGFRMEYDYIKDIDLSRPVKFSYPNTVKTDPKPYDIYSQHYAGYNAGLGDAKIPVVHDEYAHIACYNLDELQRDVNVRNFWGESIKTFWENIFETDGALGGALWGGIDDVFYIPDGTSERWQTHSKGQTAGYGEWGSVLDAYLREKPEAYLTKKAYSPVRVDEENAYLSGGALVVPVKNWFDHTNFNELTMEYQLDDAQPVSVPVTANIEPHGNGEIRIDGVAKSVSSANVKFYTADGIMVDEYNIPVQNLSYHFAEPSAESPAVEDGESELKISGNDFTVSFDKTTGMITSGVFKDQELITGGPYLHVGGNPAGGWTLAEGGLTHEIALDGQAQVTIKGAYGNGQEIQFVIKISKDGILDNTYTFLNGKMTGDYTEVGVGYDIPDTVESVDWVRDGLYTAYPEDHIGRNDGTALRTRENAATNPDQYGVLPQWPWKDDMKNYFVYATEDLNNGVATNDFRTMRENIWYYDVNFSEDPDAPHISVESENADVSARVNLSYDLGYIDDRDTRIKYEGAWATYNSTADYAGTESYSSKVGDYCELKFTGTGVNLIGSKQKNVGKLKIYIDDVFKEEIDTFSALGNDLKQTIIYGIDGLEDGEHTIKVETSGGNAECIVIDAFEILGAPEGGPRIDSRLVVNKQWYYPGLGWGK